jgi:uncharacterized Zn-binding protein involved in type VI secretion
MKRTIFCLLLAFAVAAPALAQSAAARVGDMTNHGGSITGPGVPSVRIGGKTAAVIDDQTTCPLFFGEPPNLIPHVGGPIVSASATVFIGGKPAARVGDINMEQAGASAAILAGSADVFIGH